MDSFTNASQLQQRQSLNKQLMPHLQSYQNVILCQICNQMIPWTLIDSHEQNCLLKLQQVQCSYCSLYINITQIETHQLQCQQRKINNFPKNQNNQQSNPQTKNLIKQNLPRYKQQQKLQSKQKSENQKKIRTNSQIQKIQLQVKALHKNQNNSHQYSVENTSNLSLSNKQVKKGKLPPKKQQKLEVECIYCGGLQNINRINIHESLCKRKSQNLTRKLPSNINKNPNKIQNTSQPRQNLQNAYQNQRLVNEKYRRPYQRNSQQPRNQNFPSQFLTKTLNKQNQRNNVNSAIESIYIPAEKKEKQSLTVSNIGRIPRTTFKQENALEENESCQESYCSICYVNFEMQDKMIKLKCQHFFHDQCVGEWLKTDSRCPMCKAKVQGFNKKK